MGDDGWPSGSTILTDFLLGRAFDRAGMRDSAVAAFERYVTTPGDNRWRWDSGFLADSFERLGELYEAEGNRATAATYYAKFAILWDHADPDLQPRVADIKVRLARLSGEVRR